VTFKAPYLPYDSLRRVADEFFTMHHPSRALPIPIESIVEIKFGIDIVPVPGIRDLYEIDSAISSDLATIYIDDFVYKCREKRYRFSLAHELSHRLVHSDIFKQFSFNTLDAWKSAITAIPEDQYSWIELQAYDLAGLILVPSEPLARTHSEVCATASSAGISLQDIGQEAMKVVCDFIGAPFGVSADVIRKRLKKDGIVP
jgi:hypothetical protein